MHDALDSLQAQDFVYKGNDGKCYLLPQYVIIEQQNTGGSSFSPSTVRYTGFSGEEMLCENVR